jgi:hypothetical protein
MPRSDATLKIDADVRGASKAITKLNKDLGAVKLNAMVNLGKAALGAGNSMIQTSYSFKQMQTALDSVSGSSKKGAEAFDNLLTLSENTQFTVSDLSSEFIKLKAAGIEPTNELMMTFADTAAITTDGLGTMTAMADMLARTTAGGLGLEDVNRLADRGVPVFRILEEQLGLSRLEISAFGKSAEGAKLITDTLFKSLSKEFGGNAGKNADHVAVALQNMGVQADLLLVAIGDTGLLTGLTYLVEGMTAVVEIAHALTDAIFGVEEALGKKTAALKKATTNTEALATKQEWLNGLNREKKAIDEGILSVSKSHEEALIKQIALAEKDLAIVKELVANGDGELDYIRAKTNVTKNSTTALIEKIEAVKALRTEEEIGNDYTSMIEGLRTETEIINDDYQSKLEILDEFNGIKALKDSEYFALKEKLEQEHGTKIAAIQQGNFDEQLQLFQDNKFAELNLNKLTEEQMLQFTKDAGVSALGALAQHNKKAFQMKKAYDIGVALMNTAMGISNALSQYPFPYNLAIAALMAVQGYAQVQTIRQQQYQGRQFGGTTTGNQPFLVGERGPEVFTPGRTGTITPNGASGGKNINISFNITATDASGFDDLLTSRKPMILGMVRQAVHEQPALLQG